MIDETAKTDAACIYDRILHAQKVFRPYLEFCDRIDRIYSDRDGITNSLALTGWTDRKYDTFWASMEVLKPAIYAKAPNIVVKPRFSDANDTDKMTAEMLERVLNSEFERGHINESMLLVRDDLALANRGVLWVTHEDDDGNSVCNEWLDRTDFLHDPARSWRDVSWVARRAWLTLDEMKDRFGKTKEDWLHTVFFGYQKDRNGDYWGDQDDETQREKCAVWEVWDKAEDRVYWVTEGVDSFLDEAKPHLNLRDFFPCPRPAYGTLVRRTLVPVPDYRRYEVHLDQINSLTQRIYDLLDQVRLRGLIGGGGDVAQAVEAAMREQDASTILIPVAGVNLVQGANAAQMVQWIPLDMIAATIQGLLESRNQLFGDFDRLSGISDIMRGETQAEETLGAQRLKSQYGSVRVKDKKDELIRVSRDAARISGEIVCDNFTQKELLEISQMDIPTRKEVDKSIKDLEKQAREEMTKLVEGMEETPPEDQEAAAAMQQQLLQAQKQIAEKYGPQFQQLSQSVVIEDVMELVHDNRARNLIIDIETDSTVMTDELAEKSVRGEFLTGFSNAIMAVQPLMAAGEQGAKLAGAMMKFALEPFNVSRDLAATIDEFVENAPEIASAMGGDQGQSEDMKVMAEAQQKLAEAEIQKAQAATRKVQADSQLKAFELEQKQAEAGTKAQQDAQKFDLELAQTKGALAETDARIEKIMAEIQKIGVDAQNQTRTQEREDIKTVADISGRQEDRAIQQENAAIDAEFRAVDAQRAERGEERADRGQQFSEQDTERQRTFAERQAEGEE